LTTRALEAWRNGHVQLVMSAEILQEYQRVGQILADEYSGTDLAPFLALLAVHSEFVNAPALPEPISADPDDDKFLACALAAGISVKAPGA
jgi:predicted nucleic acid-binding protein